MVDTAGAHPVTYGYGTTIDMENGAEVSVSEIANADGESAITDVQRAVNYLRDEIAENPDKYLEGAAKYLDENTAGNYGCYFGKDKLIIFAAAGSIAPYSSGMLKFEVPLK